MARQPAVVTRAERTAINAKSNGLLPKDAADRIETLVCSRCITQKCKGCPVEGMIAKLQAKEVWG